MWLYLPLVCDDPIKTRLTPVKVMCLVWSTSLQKSVWATSRRWQTSCFTFLWIIKIWKLCPFFFETSSYQDSRSFSFLCVIAITQLLCQWHILSHIAGPVWGWLLPAWLLELITVALVPQQFCFYSTKLSWNKWPQAHNNNQVGYI